MRLKETASQTAGPFVHIGLAPAVGGLAGIAPLGATIAGPEVAGVRISVVGRVFDGAGAPVRDCVVEVWQADPQGRFAGAGAAAGFHGFGRVAADLESGEWRIETVKPGALPGDAPHLALWIAARGINIGLHTRLYFPEDDHGGDRALGRVEPARRATLIAGGAAPDYRFDVRLQGAEETVFFDV